MNEPKPCYDGGTCRNADLVEELNEKIANLEEELTTVREIITIPGYDLYGELTKSRKRIAELEEKCKLYAALDDPSKPEAVAAIQMYILRYFDDEKTQSLMRTFGFPQYVEMANRITELEQDYRRSLEHIKYLETKVIQQDAELDKHRWIPVEERMPEDGDVVVMESIVEIKKGKPRRSFDLMFYEHDVFHPCTTFIRWKYVLPEVEE